MIYTIEDQYTEYCYFGGTASDVSAMLLDYLTAGYDVMVCAYNNLLDIDPVEIHSAESFYISHLKQKPNG